MNQGAALIHIYIDGTVLISHAGVEIGQGVHTKMIQVKCLLEYTINTYGIPIYKNYLLGKIATRALGVPGEKIRIMETATDKVPNSTPSSASMTTDLNGGAVLVTNLFSHKQQ